MRYDNPAGRLLEVLIKVKQYPKNADARQVWQEIFSLPSRQPGPLLSAKLATTMLLAQQTIDLLAEDHPELADPPPSWAYQVSGAFQTHNVHGHIESFVNNISDDTVNNVRTMAVLLDKGSKRKAINADQLQSIKNELATLLQEVLESAQEDEIKIYLARALRKIIAAIDEYHLTGANPILERIEQTVGHALVDSKYRSFLTDTELGSKILNSLTTASNIVTIAVGMPQLAHGATLLLKGPV